MDNHFIIPDLQPLITPINDVFLDPKNLRVGHDITQIQASLFTYGQRKPIVVNRATGFVEAGNGTLQAAKMLGWSHIAVVFVDDDKNTAEGYAIADNRTAELSKWDNKALLATLKRLPTDIPTGFDAEAMGRLLEKVKVAESARLDEIGDVSDSAESDDDIVQNETTAVGLANLRAKWGVKEGDVWKLPGKEKEHFVICGDCRELETWKRLRALSGEQFIHGCFTSPPYAQQRQNQYGGVDAADYVGWWEDVQGLLSRYLDSRGSFFINIKPHVSDGQRSLYVMDLVLAMAREWEWKYIDEFAWNRVGIPGRWPNRFKNSWESVYQFSRLTDIFFFPDAVRVDAAESTVKDKRMNKKGGYAATGSGVLSGHTVMPDNWENKGVLPSNVINLNLSIKGVLHPAMFPMELPLFFITAFSRPNDVWIDPFVGAGTTLLAADSAERVGLGIELKPEYVAVALERWERETGYEPNKLA